MNLRWIALLVGLYAGLAFHPNVAAGPLRAGVAAVDISPPFFPVIRNGSFLEGQMDRVVDRLHVRAFVIDDGSEVIAIAIVDSCMLPRDFCDETKRKVHEAVGIRADRILLAATHTHSAPSVMDYCLGSRQDPRYALFLPGRIVSAIRQAFEQRRPVEIASGRIRAAEFTKNRRWLTHPDKLLVDPFGERSVRAMMHPGYSNPDYLAPSGPIDPWLTILSLRTLDGEPLGVLANFSMHYFGGHPGASADYYGEFARQLSAAWAPGNSGFVAAMSQGTSGDLWWGDYSRSAAQSWSMNEYTKGLVDKTLDVLRTLEYRDDVTLSMAEKRITLSRRLPSEGRKAWAKEKLNQMDGRRPKDRPEVYAEQSQFIQDNPEEEVILQALRIGDLAITGMPNEVYALTGLKLKSVSPLPLTMNCSLANGAAGYIPPPEQHELGGYTTWPARTAGLVVSAEPTIVSQVSRLLEEVSGEPRNRYVEASAAYAAVVQDSNPSMRWRMGNQERLQFNESGRVTSRFEGKVALHLPGIDGRGFDDEEPSRAAQFLGGRFLVPDIQPGSDYSLEFWFKSYVPASDWKTPQMLFAWGSDRLVLTAANDGAPRLKWGDRTAQTPIQLRQWYHVVVVRKGDSIQVYLNGVRPAEISEKDPVETVGRALVFAASLDHQLSFEGRLDEIALFKRALSPGEIRNHFRAAGREESAARTPEESMAETHVRAGYRLELVAAEPLVRDPVAIDWGDDGRLWVAEMADYPYGMDGKGQPGGRVRFLVDSDDDGRFDRSQVFLEEINFPTSVMPWRNGVFVAAAPEILFAEDRTGDGRADHVEIVFRGFMEGNQQLRVNSLRWGLDGWIYCASGGHHAGFGARNQIEALRTNESIPIGSRDFRFHPDTGQLEALSGPSQFGRVRDDWGRWFGVQNSHPLWHYVLSDPYLSRNESMDYPDPRQQLRTPSNPRVFMNKPVQKRYHSFEQSSRFTSACGPALYRDELLFPREPGLSHAFTCEPFHNVVQHHVLAEAGVSFQGRRANEDGAKDFFASADRWSRPVMTRTGPDGALYVVDMYRYMIEHPDWLPEAGKEELKPFYRSGEAFGRIYRIVPDHEDTQGERDRWELLLESPVMALNSPNGRLRDLAQQRIVSNRSTTSADELQHLLRNADRDTTRAQALATLHALELVTDADLEVSLRDPVASVRRLAVRYTEERATLSKRLESTLLSRLSDSDHKVQLQLALALGEWSGRAFSQGLVELARRHRSDAYMVAAITSSLVPHFDDVTDALIKIPEFTPAVARMGAANSDRFEPMLAAILNGELIHWPVLAAWLDALDEKYGDWSQAFSGAASLGTGLLPRVEGALTKARKLAMDGGEDWKLRAALLALLGRIDGLQMDDARYLVGFVGNQQSVHVRNAALIRLRSLSLPQIGAMLVKDWSQYLPSDRAKIIDLLLSREPWTEALITALEQGRISAAELNASRRQRLERHRNKAIASRANRVLRTTDESRASIERHYRQSLKLVGDPVRGRSLFEVRCSICHAFDGVGRSVGPDLRSVTDRSPGGLLNAIIQPNLAIEPRYLGYEVTLRDGESIQGMVEREIGGSLTLRLLDGAERTLTRGAIQSLVSTQQSFMPEGLEEGLTVAEMSDLLAFLTSSSRVD